MGSKQITMSRELMQDDITPLKRADDHYRGLTRNPVPSVQWVRNASPEAVWKCLLGDADPRGDQFGYGWTRADVTAGVRQAIGQLLSPDMIFIARWQIIDDLLPDAVLKCEAWIVASVRTPH
jgi:hypothetical protein